MKDPARTGDNRGDTRVIAEIDFVNGDRIRDFFEIIQASGREIINHVNAAAFGKQASNESGADEAGTACDYISIHYV